MEETTQLELWEKPKEDVSIDDMDSAITELREAKSEYDVVKKDVDRYKVRVDEAQRKVMDLMKRAGKETYIVEGIGRATLREELSVRTPKSPEQKKAFFDWILKHMGEDAYYAYLNVNSQSLNSLFKQKVEEYGLRGEVLEIDGLEPATSFTKLSFRKS